MAIGLIGVERLIHGDGEGKSLVYCCTRIYGSGTSYIITRAAPFENSLSCSVISFIFLFLLTMIVCERRGNKLRVSRS